MQRTDYSVACIRVVSYPSIFSWSFIDTVRRKTQDARVSSKTQLIKQNATAYKFIFSYQTIRRKMLRS